MKHIGYYNDIEDIKAYANCSADKVVEDMLNGVGSFHFVNEDYDVGDIYPETIEYTSNREYMVVRDLPNDLSLLGEEGVCDFFVDIYKLK